MLVNYNSLALYFYLGPRPLEGLALPDGALGLLEGDDLEGAGALLCG